MAVTKSPRVREVGKEGSDMKRLSADQLKDERNVVIEARYFIS